MGEVAMVDRYVASIVEQLRCLDERLTAIQRLLSYEYGQPVQEVYAHDPRRLPVIMRVQLAANASRTLDLVTELGKPATRGHVVNIGANPVTLAFSQRHSPAGRNPTSSPYLLPPATTVDLSFFVDEIVLTAGANPADAQIWVQ